jgi:ABC-type Fe3+ transport system substrate-binding protein
VRATLIFLIMAAAILAAVLLLRTTGGSDLRIISPHWEGIRVEFARAFNDWRAAQGQPPVAIEWFDIGGMSDILRYLRANKAASNAYIDILFGGGLDPYLVLAGEGVLAPCPLPAATLSNIPPSLHGVPLYETNGLWYGAALSGFGILYNNVVLGKFNLPAPRTWEGLADPALRGWVGSADPRKSGAVHMVYEIILQAYGWDKGMRIVSAMCGNVRGFSQTASSVPRDISVGDIAAGMCIDTYAWSTLARIGEDRLTFVMPQGLTVANPDAIALLRDAPHRDVAVAFIDFVMAEAGQKVWMLKKNSLPGAPTEFDLAKMPVWPALFDKYKDYVVFDESPFAWTNVVRYDAYKGALRWNIINDYLGCLFIDAHAACKAAWALVCTRPSGDPLHRLFMQQQLTEQQLLTLAAGAYTNPLVRVRCMNTWASDARRRYATILKHATQHKEH